MIDLVQTLGSGILVGLVYALLGLCIVIIFKASEAFNFAIGEFLIIGSFLFYTIFFNETIPSLHQSRICDPEFPNIVAKYLSFTKRRKHPVRTCFNAIRSFNFP